MKRWFTLFVLTPIVLVALGFLVVSATRLDDALLNQNVINVEVKAGDNLSKLVARWHDAGLLLHPQTLLLYARIKDKQLIHQGEYQIVPDTSHAQLLAQLNQGKVIQRYLTLIEGWTYQQTLSYLRQQSLLKNTESTWQASQFIDGYQSQLGLEGMIYPDTYAYSKGESINGLLERAHQRLVKVLAQEWQNRSDGLPYQNPYEALIMASIVEKETGLDSERAEIAGVFVRRLNKGMRLQTDPTVIYGLGDAYQGDIKRVHLRTASAYNTYMINGLPPTPIALVGREAIHAALHPLEGDSLYFVAKGDGSHQFSATLAEHEAAVQHYQIERRAKQYRSAPQSE